MTALVRVESGGHSLAIHDNTWQTSYAPRNSTEAVSWAGGLLALGHSVDLGLSQINSANLPALGLTVRQIFDPCTNLQAGARILSADYREAAARFGPGQIALRRALGAYNTGSLYAGQSYINQILAAAGLPPEYETPDPADPPRPPKSRKTPAAPATPKPFYTTQHTPGSPVEVLVGTP